MKSLDPVLYQNFLRDFYAGKFKGQRLGEAFTDTFRLDKMSDQESLGNLYELDGESAIIHIRSIFFN